MDRQRFNELLLAPSKVENNDIRQLNEYRKKYPFFQGLYVVVAKALQERDHPKTDAFIKKAAIYSANRAHLKTIIESDDFFKAHLDQHGRASEALEPLYEPKVVKEEKRTQVEEKQAEPPSVEASEQAEKKSFTAAPTKTNTNDTVTYESHGDDPVINELKATKARIEALLRGELPQEDTAEETPPATANEKTEEQTKGPQKTQRNKQIEIIEKFIAEDPRIDIRKKAAAEGDQEQEDLAQKSLNNSEDFETETVAKLMIKQGKVKKGLAIYEKLHLKFPEKSSYFASQIQKIKSKHNV